MAATVSQSANGNGVGCDGKGAKSAASPRPVVHGGVSRELERIVGDTSGKRSGGDSGKDASLRAKQNKLSPQHDIEGAGFRYGALLVATLIFGLASYQQPSVLSDWGMMDPKHEAQLLQLASTLLVAACVSIGVIIVLGVQDMVWHAMDSAKAVLAPLAACSVFMIVGPTLMLLNKHIMQDFNFPYPLSLSCCGLVASMLFSRILVWLGLAQLRTETQTAVAGSAYLWTVLPIAAARAVTLATGNAVYLFLSVGFIQMLKAFTPAIVLLAMFLCQVEVPPRPSMWCVLVIVVGTVVEVNGELHATATGLALMMTSCVGEAIAMVLSQKMLQDLKFSEVETLYYLSLPSAIMLGSLAVVLEWDAMFKAGHHAIFFEHPLVLLAAASLGVAVNFLTLIVVRATSSVTVKILNTFRCIGLVIVGMVFYNETHTERQLAGYGVSLLGFVGYNYFQLNRRKALALEAWADSRWQQVVREFGGRMPAKNIDRFLDTGVGTAGGGESM